MLQNSGARLGEALAAGGSLFGAGAKVALGELTVSSSLNGGSAQLRGRSVLLRTSDQLVAALAMIELDGVARRLVLCPPGVAEAHLSGLMATAEIDAVVCDANAGEPEALAGSAITRCSTVLAPLAAPRQATLETQWILLTSGTTGRPKLVVHTLASLTAPIARGKAPGGASVWSTFYDIRRYGGLQIFLRAMLGRTSLVLSSPDETVGDFLTRAGGCGVTHISGTPSHWRRALMSPAARRIAPGYVRLSGEIADQGVLDALRAAYPDANIAHAFASTEAGVAFEVGDGLAGFPARLLEETGGPVEMKNEQGSLRIRSSRTASAYLEGSTLKDAAGFIDTRDQVERRGDRYYFVGRTDGVINVGGLKVHPEEVEAVINRHPSVRMSRVKSQRNAITGAVLVADVVVRDVDGPEPAGVAETVKCQVLEACHRELPAFKVPALVRLVSAIDVTAAGKLVRHDA